MAGYNEIRGLRVKYLSADPANPEDGQVWYNSTTGNLRVQGIGVGAWSSGSPTTSQHGDGSGCGEQTATVIWGGYSPNNPQITNSTEEYNGSGWTTGGNYPTTTIGSGSAGVLTAALGISGRTGPGGNTNVVNNYDGSTWTATTNYPASNYGTIGFGSQTAAVGLGGNPRADAAPSGVVNSTFDWNGSAWTASGNYPSTISNAGGTGSETAGITAGGYDNTGTSQTFSATYDGSTWTLGPNINRPADQNMAQAGNQTSSLIYGGSANAVKTESWDGVAWSNQPDLAGVGGYGGQMGATNNSSGSSKGLLAATREGSNYPVATEEYNFGSTTVTPAAWSSANSQSVPSYGRSGWGTANAGWLAGGNFPSAKTDTEEYDGTNWTSGGTLNTARGSASVGGPQTAAIFASGSRNSAVELYDGSTWTSTTAIPTVRSGAGGGGTQTSLVVFGGSVAGAPTFPISTAVEEWNGSAWTAGTSLPSFRGALNGSAFGTSSDDAFSAGGVTAPAPGAIPHSVTSETLSYNGTTWTEEADILTARASTYAFGTSGSAIIGGGDTNNSGAVSVLSEQWNGTSWSTNPSIATARYTGGRAGTSSSGWIGGGYPGGAPSSNATEEFSPGTVTANPASNLTVS